MDIRLDSTTIFILVISNIIPSLIFMHVAHTVADMRQKYAKSLDKIAKLQDALEKFSKQYASTHPFSKP